MNTLLPLSGLVAAVVIAVAVVAGLVQIARLIVEAVVRVKVARHTGTDPGPAGRRPRT